MLYFAYGSNMAAAQMRGSCPGAQLMHRSARLDGHQLDFRRMSQRWQGGASDIVACDGAGVFGCVWELPEDDIPRLDRREGVAVGAYRQVPVTLTADDESIPAFTYTVVEKSPHPVAPTAEYARLMLDGAAELGLPLDYQAHMKRLLDRLGVAL
jgi:cation transport regulator ChaC